MRFALLALLLPAFAAQGEDAEKLFRDLEKKIGKAKAFRVVADIDVTEKGKEAKIHIAITLAQGNKARMEMKGEVEGKQRSMQLVSDGKNLEMAFATAAEKGKGLKEATPDHFTNLVATVIARVGLIGGFKAGPGRGKGPAPDLEKLFGARDFKMGKAETVNGRDAKVLHYAVKIAGQQDAKVTLWLDAKTLLPIKRLILADNDKARISEAYTEFNLNPKLDAKVFALAP